MMRPGLRGPAPDRLRASGLAILCSRLWSSQYLEPLRNSPGSAQIWPRPARVDVLARAVAAQKRQNFAS